MNLASASVLDMGKEGELGSVGCALDDGLVLHALWNQVEGDVSKAFVEQRLLKGGCQKKQWSVRYSLSFLLEGVFLCFCCCCCCFAGTYISKEDSGIPLASGIHGLHMWHPFGLVFLKSFADRLWSH